MVMMFVGGVVLLFDKLLFYSYCRKSTGQEFFVSTRTLKGVKLLTAVSSSSSRYNKYPPCGIPEQE